MEPQYHLDYAVAVLDPVVTYWRAPAATVLFLIVAFRPRSPSHCIMVGRVFVLMACVLWFAAVYPPLAACARIADWAMFASAMSSHVCEVAMNWSAVRDAKRVEYPSPFHRIWSALRHRLETSV